MDIDPRHQLAADRRRDVASGFEAARLRRQVRRLAATADRPEVTDRAAARPRRRLPRGLLPRLGLLTRQTLKRNSITSPSATS